MNELLAHISKDKEKSLTLNHKINNLNKSIEIIKMFLKKKYIESMKSLINMQKQLNLRIMKKWRY